MADVGGHCGASQFLWTFVGRLLILLRKVTRTGAAVAQFRVSISVVTDKVLSKRATASLAAKPQGNGCGHSKRERAWRTG